MKILYWGHRDFAPIPYFRAQQFQPYWPDLGIEVGYVRHEEFGAAAEEDWAPIRWADVVIFRRWYDAADPNLVPAWDFCRKEGKALVYDSDDWDLGTPDVKIPSYRKIREARPTIERMAREADVVTTSTPELARRWSLYSRRTPHVLRNAVELSLYEPTEPRTDDRLTVLNYGSYERLRDYFGSYDYEGHWQGGYCAAAVKEHRLRSIWIGDEGVGDIPTDFDVIRGWTADARDFFRMLGNAHADIGVAPLAGDEFDRCKSELHWLDLSAAGCAVIAERMKGRNPYDVVRDGTDALLARGRREWSDAMKRLVREPNLRSDLVASSRERLAREYDPRGRAGEWAEVFMDAASGSRREEVA